METTSPVHLCQETHGRLAKLVGDKKAAGMKTTMKAEAEAAIRRHINHEKKKLKPAA